MVGGSGTLVMATSTPIVVNVELGCSDLLEVNDLSIGRARTLA